jgi:hypothetical protein
MRTGSINRYGEIKRSRSELFSCFRKAGCPTPHSTRRVKRGSGRGLCPRAVPDVTAINPQVVVTSLHHPIQWQECCNQALRKTNQVLRHPTRRMVVGAIWLLAVEAVCSEPVSARFPDDGKSTGTFLCYLPNFSQNQAVSYCNKKHYFIFGNGPGIHNRKLSGNSSIPLTRFCSPGVRADWSCSDQAV